MAGAIEANANSGDGARPPRTAVVVIAGVGDNPSGSASEALTSGLLHHGRSRFGYAQCVEEEYAPDRSWCGEDPEPSQSVTRHTLFTPDGVPVADVYEAWWADLSRFPGATRSALLATVGMLQQATTIGRAALRGGGALRADPAGGAAVDEHTVPRGFRLGGILLAVIEWLLAVPVVSIVAVHIALIGATDYAMLTNGSRTRPELVGLAVLSLLLVIALCLGMRWYARRRPGVAAFGVPLVAAAIALAAWRSSADGNVADKGMLDAILLLAVYPLRIAWMLIALLALVTIAVVVVQRLRRNAPEAGWRRIGTASLSMFGPFGLALVAALVYAAAGAAVQKLASQHRFTGGPPWCLPSLTSWQPATCPGTVQNTYDWGVALFQTAVIPMIYVAGLAVLMVAGTALFVVATALRDRLRTGMQVTRTMLQRRMLRVAPWAVSAALAPAAALVLLSYVPGGDTVLVWQRGGPGGLGGVAAVVAAASGWVIGGLLAAARTLKLGTGTLRNQGNIGDGVRVPLDLAYDIATYLRQPGRAPSRQARPGTRAARRAELARLRNIVPRQRILGRIAALLAHIDMAGGHDRCLIVSHSQGTVLATALLAQQPGKLRIPGGTVTLVTMGSPLRHVYAQRLPLQFSWVCDLAGRPDEFIHSLDGPWTNFGADDDLVGRTVFSDEPDQGMPEGVTPDGEVTGWEDRNVGPGGHGSYWTSPAVMTMLAGVIAVP
ncbi:MAG TPA: hypothetical protein VN193_15720 [Candidatus Angelobacter sp.]|jgi:hypothetical protein|nr:hypothetical protein [Candidatus Angelobacter sp.]